MDWRPISADSHITEPPNCYLDHIDPAFRDRAPHVVNKEGMGDIYVVDGMKTPVPMGLVAAAGLAPKDIRLGGAKFGDLHRSGWDPSTCLADQDKDGTQGSGAGKGAAADGEGKDGAKAGDKGSNKESGKAPAKGSKPFNIVRAVP